MTNSEYITVKGLSGCEVTIGLYNSEAAIKKSCYDEKGVRLVKQINKQEIWEGYLKNNSSFSTPKIFNLDSSTIGTVCYMEYVRGKSFALFLEESTLQDLNTFTQKLVKLIQFSLTKSTIKRISGSVFIDKARQVMSGLDGYESVGQKIITLCDGKYFSFPVGVCHGDLTLSNMIFSEENIFLIDFLDVYIESPLLDIVKLEQDLIYKWSLRRVVGRHDIVKIKISLNYISNCFFTEFEELNEFKEAIKVIRLLNWYRILPYADENDAEYVSNVIESILK